jgi:hypothetical protein
MQALEHDRIYGPGEQYQCNATPASIIPSPKCSHCIHARDRDMKPPLEVTQNVPSQPVAQRDCHENHAVVQCECLCTIVHRPDGTANGWQKKTVGQAVASRVTSHMLFILNESIDSRTWGCSAPLSLSEQTWGPPRSSRTAEDRLLHCHSKGPAPIHSALREQVDGNWRAIPRLTDLTHGHTSTHGRSIATRHERAARGSKEAGRQDWETG